MRDRYDEAEAQRYLDRYAAEWGETLALRVYTSHLIGAEESLVLHGGGNTSCKDTYTTLLGDAVDALFVKGSGWNLGDIEPQGFPAVALDHMLRVVRMPALTDEQMVNEQRTHLFDAGSPNPSIETLLHAALPARFVDHSHADAILALTNHPDGEEHVRAALGDDLLLIPYVKPGFDLARLAAERFAEHPDCTGMVLMQHGLFTWGETAAESYRRHIDLVTKAEAYLAAHPGPRAERPTAVALQRARERAARLAPVLRGALGAVGDRWILHHRVSADVLAQVDDDRLARWVAAGPLTPDHVIRTKLLGLHLPLPAAALDGDEDPDGAVHAAVQAYRDAYGAYVDRQFARVGDGFTRLDDTPRVVLVPGVGVFGVGASPKDARVVADITEHTLAVKEACEGLGPFQGLPEDDLFDMEYWSLEQAKLKTRKAAPLARTVALITGAAGAIGFGIAKVLHAAGAQVVLADVDLEGARRAAETLGGDRVLAVRCDVTVEASVEAAFEAAAAAFGGVDVVVPNAGVAHVAPITDLDADAFRRVMEVNAHGVFLTVKVGSRHLIRQGTGGHVVLVSSKNVLGPGASFGAYSASKAAAHQLCRVAALELAPHDVKVNLVTPDAVFGTDDVASGLWAEVGPDRAASKGLDPSELPEHYRQRNLLQATITGEDVGRAVRFFVSDQTPTTGAVLPVDGGVAGAFPR